MTDRRADDGTLHMADCPYTAGAGWCSECGRGDGERDCCCDALRACTVRVLGEVRGVFQSERDLLHSAGYRKEFTTEEWEAVDCWLSAVVVTIDRLAQEAP